MLFGRMMGLLLVLIGSTLGFWAYLMLDATGATFRLLAAGPGIAAAGVALLFAPGRAVTLEQMRNAPERDRAGLAQAVFADAPMGHKVAWGVAGAVGTVVGLIGFDLV